MLHQLQRLFALNVCTCTWSWNINTVNIHVIPQWTRFLINLIAHDVTTESIGTLYYAILIKWWAQWNSSILDTLGTAETIPTSERCPHFRGSFLYSFQSKRTVSWCKRRPYIIEGFHCLFKTHWTNERYSYARRLYIMAAFTWNNNNENTSLTNHCANTLATHTHMYMYT